MIFDSQQSKALSIVCALMLVAGCGKHEQAARSIGAASGAVMGAALSGRNSRGTGAIIGGLIGSMVVGEQGRELDKQEEANDRAIKRAVQQRKIERLQDENMALRENQMRWCARCHKKIMIPGASSCPSCGGALIQEKACRTCARVFSLNDRSTEGYRYCPYCKDGVMLIGR